MAKQKSVMINILCKAVSSSSSSKFLKKNAKKELKLDEIYTLVFKSVYPLTRAHVNKPSTMGKLGTIPSLDRVLKNPQEKINLGYITLLRTYKFYTREMIIPNNFANFSCHTKTNRIYKVWDKTGDEKRVLNPPIKCPTFDLRFSNSVLVSLDTYIR